MLDQQANSDLNPVKNPWSIVKGEMIDTTPYNENGLKGAIKDNWKCLANGPEIHVMWVYSNYVTWSP